MPSAEGEQAAVRSLIDGICGAFGDRLTTIDVRRGGARETSTVPDPKRRLLGRLHGMTIGVSHGSPRAVIATRLAHPDLRVEMTAVPER